MLLKSHLLKFLANKKTMEIKLTLFSTLYI